MIQLGQDAGSCISLSDDSTASYAWGYCWASSTCWYPPHCCPLTSWHSACLLPITKHSRTGKRPKTEPSLRVMVPQELCFRSQKQPAYRDSCTQTLQIHPSSLNSYVYNPMSIFLSYVPALLMSPFLLSLFPLRPRLHPVLQLSHQPYLCHNNVAPRPGSIRESWGVNTCSKCRVQKCNIDLIQRLSFCHWVITMSSPQERSSVKGVCSGNFSLLWFCFCIIRSYYVCIIMYYLWTSSSGWSLAVVM